MDVKLNHTIFAAHDKRVSATFLADILGLPQPTPFGPFLTVPAENDVTLRGYFEDPSGHLLEILTRPYGSGD